MTHDLDDQLRAALRSHARALVPDTAVRPSFPHANPGADHAAVSDLASAAHRRRRRRRLWLACGLTAATAAAAVVAAVTVHTSVDARRLGPGPAASTGSTGTPSPTAVVTTPAPTPDPVTDATAPPPAVFPPVSPPHDSLPAVSDVAVYANCTEPSADPPVVRPGAITLACADNGENLLQLTWTSWGTDRATGTGVLEYRTCATSCADGSTVHRQATSVTLRDPVTGADGVPVWTRLQIDPDPVADGTYRLQTVR